MISPMEARVSSVAPMLAAVRLNVCFLKNSPPARIDTPKTSSTLPMIEPVSDALTSGYISGPRARAMSAMISSAALPKVALRRPPSAEPIVSARFSVARPMRPAKGITAMQETRNSQSGSTWRNFRTMPTGSAGNSQYSGSILKRRRAEAGRSMRLLRGTSTHARREPATERIRVRRAQPKQSLELGASLVGLPDLNIIFEQQLLGLHVGGIELDGLLAWAKHRRPDSSLGLGLRHQVVEFMTPGVHRQGALQISGCCLR